MDLTITSITTGIFRLSLLWLFLFYCNKIGIKYNKKLDLIDFIISKWFNYGSVLVVIIFGLVALNLYDLFNVIFILSIYVLFDIYQFKNIKHIYIELVKTVRRSLLFIVKHIELNEPLSFWISIKAKQKQKNKGVIAFCVLLLVSVVTFAFRVSLFKYDKYVLSPLWIEDLNKVISYNYHNSFDNLNVVEGEYMLINFYSKLVNISPEVSLESFGVLQPICLSIVLIWVIKKIKNIGYTIPIITALIFALFIGVTPININFITQQQSLFLALTFAIPLMVYIAKPEQLSSRFLVYFFKLTIAFIAIGLIDVFVLLIILPPFIVIIALQPMLTHIKYRLLTAFAFLLAFLILCISYKVLDNTFELAHFLKINLIAISSFTYLPHLIIPYDSLMNWVLIASIISVLGIARMYYYNNSLNRLSLLFLGYYITIMILNRLNLILIDVDLFYRAMAVILPLIVGVNILVYSMLINSFFKINLKRTKHLFPGLLLLMLTYGCYSSQHKVLFAISEVKNNSKEILEVYDDINNDYLPYTYAVVNNNKAQLFSEQKHFFICYENFYTDYMKRDSIYQFHKNNSEILIKHPEYTLPQSVLVFIYKNGIKQNTVENIKDSNKTKELLDILKQKGRKTTVFYESETIKVFEIINKPKSSKVADLIFKVQ